MAGRVVPGATADAAAAASDASDAATTAAAAAAAAAAARVAAAPPGSPRLGGRVVPGSMAAPDAAAAAASPLAAARDDGDDGSDADADGASDADDEWRHVFPAHQRVGDVVVRYPTEGWDKWRPELLLQLHAFVYVYVFLVVVEGVLMEGVDYVSSLNADDDDSIKQMWFWSTVLGDRPFFQNYACFPTMFDQLFSNGIQALVGVASYFFAVACGEAKQAVFFDEKSITIQHSRPTSGIKRIVFGRGGVDWAEPYALRGLFGPTQRQSTSVWVGFRRSISVQETGHLDDKLNLAFLAPQSAAVGEDACVAGFGVVERETFTAFPLWELIHCGTSANKRRLLELLQGVPAKADDATLRGLLLPCLPSSVFVQPVQREMAYTRDEYDSIEANMYRGPVGAASEVPPEPVLEWGGTLFSFWPYVPGIACVAFCLAFFDALLKPNSVTVHALWGRTPTAHCGTENTGQGWLTVCAIFSPLLLGAVAFFQRGKYWCTVRVYENFVVVQSARSATTFTWADATSLRIVPRLEASLYRSGSAVLKVQRFERVDRGDVVRDGCCGVFGFGTLWDKGIGAGVAFINGQVDHTKSRPSANNEVYLEVPHLKRHVHELLEKVPRFQELLRGDGIKVGPIEAEA
ncbi:hypothetical protein M885DRAFT_621216 [Pelagophyceae sp. CCMP2097]|nr:hypothetical protein M885DRAFT_621216 [Pelagophyceae sp. CCMP2097]